MKKTVLIRLISVLLLLATAATLILTACSENGGAGNNTDPSSTNPTDPQSGTVADEIRQKYAGTDFGGASFTILGIEPAKWWYGLFMADTFNEIWYETDSAEPLESAIYTRNRMTEDLLHIEIKPIFVETAEEVSERVRNALETGDTNFDLALGSMYEMLTVSREGKCYNLYDIETLDLSHPWWDQNFVNDMTMFHDRLYAISGDMNVYDDMSVGMIMFNKDLITAMKMDNPYDLVHQNQWVIDNFAAMAKAATYDTGDGALGPDDNWGCWVGTGGTVLFSGFGLPMTAQDSDGIPQLMLDKEEYVNAASKLYELMFTSDICFDHSCETDKRDEMFAEDRLLFYYILTCQLNTYRSMDTDFGIVPIPKLNPEQSGYSSSVNQHFFTTYVIPSFNRDPDRTGTVMEVMGGFSVETVYETTFGTMLGYDSKMLRDNDSKEMLDIIFGSKRYDFSILGLGDNIGRCFSEMYAWGSFMYESSVDMYKRTAKAQLNRIVTDFEFND